MSGDLGKQKPMPGFMFRVMAFIMSVMKRFRDIDGEVGLAGIGAGDFVLDFGCGPGFNTIPTARRVGDAGKVFALDIDPRAIETVEAGARRYGLRNIKTILSDCDTGLRDEGIDVVYLHNTLPLVRNKKRVLDEIHRVLKVGGRLSYISRSLSRVAGEDPMSDERLRECLEAEHKFVLIRDRRKHLVFKKTG